MLAIHRDQIDSFGGAHGLGDLGLLESALEQPQASFGGRLLHPGLHEQAAAYLFHLVNNHPFLDGNKRVALAVTDVFLRINGIAVTASDPELFDLVIGAASGSLGKEEITEFLAANSRVV